MEKINLVYMITNVVPTTTADFFCPPSKPFR